MEAAGPRRRKSLKINDLHKYYVRHSSRLSRKKFLYTQNKFSIKHKKVLAGYRFLGYSFLVGSEGRETPLVG